MSQRVLDLLAHQMPLKLEDVGTEAGATGTQDTTTMTAMREAGMLKIAGHRNRNELNQIASGEINERDEKSFRFAEEAGRDRQASHRSHATPDSSLRGRNAGGAAGHSARRDGGDRGVVLGQSRRARLPALARSRSGRSRRCIPAASSRKSPRPPTPRRRRLSSAKR